MVPQCSHTAELIRLYAHDVGSSSYINYNSIKLFFFFFFKKRFGLRDHGAGADVCH